MKKVEMMFLAGFCFVLLAITLVFAFDASAINITEGDLPTAVTRMLGNQRINVYIDDSFVISAETASAKFYIKKESFEKPTLEIYTDSETLDEIMNSENPQEKALEAYNTGRIRIIKRTFGNKLRFFFANLFFRKQISGAVIKMVGI
jgi:hypothetical protein